MIHLIIFEFLNPMEYPISLDGVMENDFSIINKTSSHIIQKLNTSINKTIINELLT